MNNPESIDDVFKIATGCDNERHNRYRFCEYCEVDAQKAKQALLTLLTNEAETLYEFYEGDGDNYAQRSAIPLSKINALFGKDTE